MFDLKVIHLDSHLFKVFHYLSIAIPVFFLVEIVLKLYAFRMEFFYRKLEILDAAIVIISFVMDFSLLLQKHKLEGFSFLILLRLWRVASIISGILLSVKIRYEKQVLKMERINLELSRKIQQLESSYSEKEQEIERLEKLLRRNGVLE
ncbi:voltage-gated hydrogen channel 1-like [Sminthopsis crassicaudata]|uniref:voltage-gated hydrogen channel 1-like n=1 Tax=Sminthopsis crassicaudata TaxID=9301 RepID=UPI003D69B6C8